MVQGDRALGGAYQTYRFQGMYAYEVKVSRNFFSRIGFGAGMVRRQLDWNRLRFGDQLNEITGPVDPNGNPTVSMEQPPESLSRNIFDLSVGVLIYSNRFYLGGSIHHINNPNESFYAVSDGINSGLPLRYTIHGGMDIDIGPDNISSPQAFISPNVLYIRQADFSQVNVGAYLGYGKVYGGLWYRHSGGNRDAVIGLAGVRHGIFRIGYSYDFTLSGLANQNTGGSHELSVMFDFSQSEKAQRQRKSRRFSDCFRMFE